VSTFGQSTGWLVRVDDVGASQVVVVEKTPHGALAVGISGGKPFAVSNRCRHLFASLGKGRVTMMDACSARGTQRFMTSAPAQCCGVLRARLGRWRAL
jgi:nitrite reductase/ring-hydroxylating ferredoxin subunit